MTEYWDIFCADLLFKLKSCFILCRHLFLPSVLFSTEHLFKSCFILCRPFILAFQDFTNTRSNILRASSEHLVMNPNNLLALLPAHQTQKTWSQSDASTPLYPLLSNYGEDLVLHNLL